LEYLLGITIGYYSFKTFRSFYYGKAISTEKIKRSNLQYFEKICQSLIPFGNLGPYVKLGRVKILVDNCASMLTNGSTAALLFHSPTLYKPFICLLLYLYFICIVCENITRAGICSVVERSLRKYNWRGRMHACMQVCMCASYVVYANALSYVIACIVFLYMKIFVCLKNKLACWQSFPNFGGVTIAFYG
jgi:hypothetical protein